jgi:transglutaminase-like putative cysteine protease
VTRRLVLALAWLLVASPARAESLPSWIDEALTRPLPTGVGHETAVVLHREKIVRVPSHGRIVTTRRLVLRLLRSPDSDLATAVAPYLRGSSEVRELHAWTIGPGNAVLRRWDRHDAADVSDLGEGQLYTEARHLTLMDESIRPGETWAWESVTEEEPLLADWVWWFGDAYPTVLSRFTLQLPEGLTTEVHAERADAMTATHTGSTWTWEMRDLAARPFLPYAPPFTTIDAGVFVRVFGPGGDRSSAGVAFHDWGAAARWIDALASPEAAVTPEIAALARTIAGSEPDTLRRIRALARFVQHLNYVSRNERIGQGWGYRPHDPNTVLATGYGDCKDKANLLCAMLRADGVDAWLLPVYWGREELVDSARVSPGQFNHCITAFRAPATARGPWLDGGRQGRLSVFDPTDPITAFGDLPADQQGTWGLLVRADHGGIVRLPVLPPDSSRLTRSIQATLGTDGSLSARLVEHRIGQNARAEIAAWRGMGEREYRGELESRLTPPSGGLDLATVTAREDTLRGRFDLAADFTSRSFARLVGGRMLTFRAAVIAPEDPWSPADTNRTVPIAVPATSLVETLSVRVPEGYTLDEAPPEQRLSNELGALETTSVLTGTNLVITRRWELKRNLVPVSRWSELRALLAAWHGSNLASVVLVARE